MDGVARWHHDGPFTGVQVVRVCLYWRLQGTCVEHQKPLVVQCDVVTLREGVACNDIMRADHPVSLSGNEVDGVHGAAMIPCRNVDLGHVDRQESGIIQPIGIDDRPHALLVSDHLPGRNEDTIRREDRLSRDPVFLIRTKECDLRLVVRRGGMISSRTLHVGGSQNSIMLRSSDHHETDRTRRYDSEIEVRGTMIGSVVYSKAQVEISTDYEKWLPEEMRLEFGADGRSIVSTSTYRDNGRLVVGVGTLIRA